MPRHPLLLAAVPVLARSLVGAACGDEADDPDPVSASGTAFATSLPGESRVLDEDGVEFEPVTVQCRAGVLVDASPPYGLQALE